MNTVEPHLKEKLLYWLLLTTISEIPLIKTFIVLWTKTDSLILKKLAKLTQRNIVRYHL